MNFLIKNNIEKIIELCKSHHVESLALFGSAAKNSMNTESDIDFLIHFSNDLELLDYADNYFSLLDSLELITGKKIDLISVNSLKNPVLIDEINRSKINLYAA